MLLKCCCSRELMPYRMTHMTNGNNPSRGNRPIRTNFNGVVIAILAAVAVAILITIGFVIAKGKRMKIRHKSGEALVSAPVNAGAAGGARIAGRLRASYLQLPQQPRTSSHGS